MRGFYFGVVLVLAVLAVVVLPLMASGQIQLGH